MTDRKKLTRELILKEAGTYALNGTLPNPDKVMRRTGKNYEALRDLKNDPHVWSCIQSRKAGLLSLDYKINPNGAGDSIVKEVESVIGGLDINRIERDILEAPLFGFQPLEIIWEHRQANRSLLLPVDLVAKPQEWFSFGNDRKLRFRQDGFSEPVAVPNEKIINACYESGYLNPNGNALLSKCYWPVMFKNGTLKFWVNFTEKFGMPVLLGKYSRGASDEESERFLNMIASHVEDTVIVVPDDMSLEMHEAAKTTSASLYRDLIKFCNAEISKAILSQTLTTELDMGSYAASQTHFKVRKEVILSDIRLVESIINKLIKIFIELNFSGPCPAFSLAMNDSDDMQMVERDSKLAQTGQINFTKEYWMRTYGFKEDEILSS